MSLARRWNLRWPKGHPQGGQFRPKRSQSIRVSPNSISYNIGYRMRVSPKVAVYGGALLRVERVRSGPGLLERAGSRLAEKIEGRGGRGAVAAAQLLSQRSIDQEGVRITRSRVVSAPTVRISNAPANERRSTASSGAQTPVKGYTARKPRAPRKPRNRTRSPKAITAGTKVA
jgi:hypothetical protein